MPFSVKDLPDSPDELERWIEEQENKKAGIKDNTRAQIIWADPKKRKKTEYAIVYIHGFKASHGEGHPIHEEVAKAFGCNLYLSRLEGHGLDTSKPLQQLSASSFKLSALKAFAISEKIGKKIIIMGTSTGGSLGLFLAATPDLKDNIAALILYSPLIEFYGSSQLLLGYSFSRNILKLLPGKDFMLTAELGSSKAEKEIWYHTYALQGALALGEFVQGEMKKETFMKVNCPVFTGYYFKNRKEQDKVVSVRAIKKMHHQISTTSELKRLKKFPEAGTHVICSGLISRSVKLVKTETITFLTDTLGLSRA